jgi:hypothetical protein
MLLWRGEMCSFLLVLHNQFSENRETTSPWIVCREVLPSIINDELIYFISIVRGNLQIQKNCFGD